MVEDTHHAQRRLEQQALRNVRSLVDKLEAEERRDGAGVVLFALVAGFVVIIAGAAMLVGAFRTSTHPAAVAEQTRFTPPPSRLKSREIVDFPRRRFVGARGDAPISNYVDAYVRRIENLAASSYPSSIHGIHGSVRLTTAIRSDGSLESVEINKGSGSAVLDAAAMNLVRAAAPFEALSLYAVNDVDVLHITRTFTFTRTAPGDAK